MIAISATVPTANEIEAAANVPTCLPSIELIGACSATQPPATAMSATGDALIHAASSQFVARRGIDHQRRVHLERARHLAHDDLATRARLPRPGASNSSSSWIWSTSRVVEPGVRERGPALTIATLMMSAAVPWIDHVHREALAELARLALARAQLGDPADAAEQRRDVAVLVRLLDRLVDELLDLREAGRGSAR